MTTVNCKTHTRTFARALSRAFFFSVAFSLSLSQLLPVSSTLLRQVTELAAEISELVEEGSDALMDLLPVGASMIINSGAARACWRRWLGAHAISGSKKKMKCCLAVELAKAHDTYSSIRTQVCHLTSSALPAHPSAAAAAAATSAVASAAAPPAVVATMTAAAAAVPVPVPVPAHVVDAAAEALCHMSLCAQTADEVDVSCMFLLCVWPRWCV